MAQPSSKLHCCVPYCTSDSRYESNLSFHTFPKSQEIRKQWIKAIRRNEGPLFKIVKCTVVCGKHFRDDEKKKTICKTKLVKGAVPSVFAWTDVTPMQRPHQRFDRKKKVLAKIGVDGEFLPMTSDEDDDDDDDDDEGDHEAVAMETEDSVFHSQLRFKQEKFQLPANMTSDMEFENVKVKVEPCEKGQGQEGDNLSQPYALELQTEDGEKIIIKQEKDVHDVYIDNALSESVYNSGTDKPVVGSSDGLAAVTVKSEPKSEPKTLLRRALIDLTADDALPISAGKIFPFIKKEPSTTPPVTVKKEKNETEDGRSSNDSTKVTKIKVEKDLQSTCDLNPENSANNASTSSQLVVSQNAANVLFKAAADIGSKDKAEKSNKIKIVFDLSGKLKEWRVEPKSSDSTMPASNLGKILMFANMMKNTNDDGTSGDKDVPNLAKLQAAINANLKAKSSSPPAKKMRMSEEESLGGEVGGDFEGYKCKICSKEFLHKHAHTAHMKIHHLSLSGLPGSSPKYRDPQACRIIPLKKSSASATTTVSSPPKTTATATKTSTSSISTGTLELISPPRPVTLVSSKTITKLGPAGPPRPSPNTQVSIQAKDLPEGAVAALTGPSTSGAYKRSAVTVPAAASCNKNVYKCELCDKVYQRIFMYQLHMKSHHREKPFMCGICDNSYYMYSDLQSHLLNHSDPNQKTAVHFTCSQCDKEYETEEDLQEHLKCHGNVETETVYECGMCGKEMNSQQELKYHMKRHMGDPFEPCKCGICMSSFSEVEELKKHIAIEHFTHAEFVCDFCKCRFLTSEALKAHMPVHEKLNEVKIKVQHRWKCKYCARRFEFRTEMVTHIAKDHPLNRFYDCSFCETSFSTKEDLQAHIKTHSVVAHFL